LAAAFLLFVVIFNIFTDLPKFTLEDDLSGLAFFAPIVFLGIFTVVFILASLLYAARKFSK